MWFYLLQLLTNYLSNPCHQILNAFPIVLIQWNAKDLWGKMSDYTDTLWFPVFISLGFYDNWLTEMNRSVPSEKPVEITLHKSIY